MYICIYVNAQVASSPSAGGQCPLSRLSPPPPGPPEDRLKNVRAALYNDNNKNNNNNDNDNDNNNHDN